jgi:ComF family protein
VAALLAFAREWALASIAPPRCAACDLPVDILAVFCPECARGVQRLTLGERESAMAAFAYGGPIARAIARFKYEERPDLARPLADLLWRAVEPLKETLAGAIVIPVPLHPLRLAERGYNQSSLLASRLSRRLESACLPLALARIRDQARQATLDRQARQANVRGAFSVRQPERIRGRPVLLVDDVRTTGATLDACAQCLVGAGAGSVRSAVLARA